VLGEFDAGLAQHLRGRRLGNVRAFLAHVRPSSVGYAIRSPVGMRAGLGAARRSARCFSAVR
jgi:hypothetical protein